MRNARRFAVAIALLLGTGGRGHAQQPADALEFWRTLGDSTLTQLIRQALAASPDVRAAAARIEGAQASRTRAALDLAPAITAGAGYSRQRLASPGLAGGGRMSEQDVWDTSLQLTWELDVFGRVRNSLRAENAMLHAAEAGEGDVHVLLAAALARTYYEVRGAQERLAFARRNAENQQRSLELTQERLEGGRGTALDTERAQAQLSSTLAIIPELESMIAAGEQRIAVLLGRTSQPALAPPGELALPQLALQLTEEQRTALLRQRADVRAAAEQQAAQRAFTAAARSAYLPRIGIGGSAGYTANQLDALGSAGPMRYAIGPVVSWAFLDLGRVKAGHDVAQAREREAAARYQQVLLQARAELETAVASYARASERLGHLAAAAQASARATELARLRFQEGGTDFLEVLDAERRQLEAEDRLAGGRSDLNGWLVAVYRATGGSTTVFAR